jgi:hypothetical protein
MPLPPTFDQAQNASIGEEKMTEDPETSTPSVAGEQAGGAEPNLEQERIAILRMIAEGRITPEEGDMLLEALG